MAASSYSTNLALSHVTIFSTLKMEAVLSSETSVNFPEDTLWEIQIERSCGSSA
jgi:hypothetical protein